MNYETVISEKDGRIGRTILNRPHKLNALNNAMLRDLETVPLLLECMATALVLVEVKVSS